MKDFLHQAANKLPSVKQVQKERDDLRYSVNEQANEIVGLREAVARLEARNDEWAKEVDELRHTFEIYGIVWPVAKQDLVEAKLSEMGSARQLPPLSGQALTIAWVIPPTDSAVSGGHRTILRTVSGLERLGHTCVLYVYDPLGTTTLKKMKEQLTHYPKTKARLVYGTENIQACDVLFATNWHTAYPVANSHATERKFYFVQDYEPFFEPVNTYSTLAENTYRFGLRGITLGAWMKEKLERDYNMPADNLDLAVTNNEFHLLEPAPQRKKIVFYARPVTPRRGFELGVLALEIFHKRHPEYEINFFGWDLSRYDIPFEFVDHGVVSNEPLNQLFNEALAGLTLSFTNMSLMPLEMMAAGCIPVVNSGATTKVGYGKYIHYAEPTPTEIADAIYEAAKASERTGMARELSEYALGFSWDGFVESVEEIIKK